MTELYKATYTLYELLSQRPLNDNVIHIAPEGYRFKGGYVAIVEYYTYANSWGDNKHLKRFRSLEAAEKFIAKMNLREGA